MLESDIKIILKYDKQAFYDKRETNFYSKKLFSYSLITRREINNSTLYIFNINYLFF